MFPRVKDILKIYEKGEFIAVKLYFEQEGMEVDPDTWCGQIKKHIDLGHKLTVGSEIERLIEKFKNYENVSKENSRTGDSSIHSEGNNQSKGEISSEGRPE